MKELRETSNLSSLTITNAIYVPMNTAAIKAEYIAKTDTGPLRIFHSTVTAFAIARQGLDNSLILGSHLHHGGSRLE